MEKRILTLTRHGYYADCTIGTLADADGSQICYVMEAPCRSDQERHVLNMTAAPEGLYSLSMKMDKHFCYRFFKLKRVPKYKEVMLCFDDEAQAWPKQTRCNLLMGMRINNEMGCLEGCHEAYLKMNEVFEQSCVFREQLAIRIVNENFLGRCAESFYHEEPPCEEDEYDLFDED